MENINMNNNNRNIYTQSDSQAALKALDSFHINSELIWDCLQSLMTLAEHNRVQLIRVPEHKVTAGKEIGKLLAKRVESPFTGPKPACSTSGRAVKGGFKRVKE
jgi:predicted lipoprotein